MGKTGQSVQSVQYVDEQSKRFEGLSESHPRGKPFFFFFSRPHRCCFCGAQINEAASVIYENVDPEANIIFGALVDPQATGM